MQNVSSNNGTPQNPSYYLSASDADTLNNIFQQISDQIESGGSSSTLTSESVVKDIIAPAFTLPAGSTAANITLETYSCTGKNGEEYTWEKNLDAMGAVATVSGDNVDVTGFNFSENYVGPVTQNGTTTYRGDKLVITFTVEPKDGYLGGNSIDTNTSAGIYENANATDPIMEFPKPKVNVPIDTVVVANADDQNVYLYDTLTGTDLMGDAAVTVGDVTLKLNEPNYGLEEWQNADVNITVAITDQDGNSVDETTFANLTEDKTYNIAVTVSPNNTTPATEGSVAVSKSGNDDASINVYKPYITYQDSAIEANTTPDYETQNFVSVTWKHGETVADPETMGDAPELTYTYDPAEKILTEETEVKASVAIGSTDVTQYVTFWRNACDAENSCDFDGGPVSATDENRVNFIVHMKTFDLTITKQGVAAEDAGAPFIVNISCATTDVDMDVVLYGNETVTIKGLPSGTYTITETGGYWRYDVSKAQYDASQTVTPNGTTASVTITNTRTEDKWLDDFASATNNFS